jgi:hypothetical protein
MNFTYEGSEYVFKRAGQTWSQEQQLISPDFGGFGGASLFRNGRLAVANPFGIYIYERQDEQWVLVAKLVSSSEFFLLSGSVNTMDWDGNTLVAFTLTGIAIFDLSSLDATHAAAP